MTVHFEVEGVGDIADVVHYRGVDLTMAAQGLPSTGQIPLRDLGFDRATFPLGRRVKVWRDSDPPLYSGYLMNSSRRFWFDVDSPDTLHRLWVLRVVDINILMSKRVTAKLSSPATIQGPVYTSDTYDDIVLGDLFSDWLDLSADDLDTTSGIHRVAHINAGQPAYPWNAGMYWVQAMQGIAGLPAAVFCIDPDRVVQYGDADEEDAPFALSNVPLSGEWRGYREATIFEDAGQLANDFTARGFGKGKAHGVFRRLIDEDSVNEHGLWQDAVTAYDVWKQATIDRIADAAVNGSPSSKRGRKDDRLEIPVTTYHHGLRAGQKVRFVNTEHDFEDVVPIRKMRMQFPAPDVIRYDMTLSHEIDALWSLSDPFPYRRITIPGFTIPEIVIPEIETEAGCEETPCGFSDDFERSVGSGWAGGLNWGASPSGVGVTSTVNGSEGTMNTGNSGTEASQLMYADDPEIGTAFGGSFDLVEVIRFSAGPTATTGDFVQHVLGFTDDQGLFWRDTDGNIGYWHAVIVHWDTTDSLTRIGVTYDIGDPDTLPSSVEWSDEIELEADVDYRVRWQVIDGETRAKIWVDGEDEPEDWHVDTSFNDNFPNPILYALDMFQRKGSTALAHVLSTSVIQVTCSIASDYRWDDFSRETDPDTDWGLASSNSTRWHKTGPGQSDQRVFGNEGVIRQTDEGVVPNQHGDVFAYVDSPAVGWTGDFDFTGTFTPSLWADSSFSGDLARWGVGLDESSPPSGFAQGVVIIKRDHLHGDDDTLSLITPSGTTTISIPTLLGINYRIRWKKTGTQHQVKFWPTFSSEPSGWDIDTTGSAITPASFFVYQDQPFTRVFAGGDLSSAESRWSDFDFDYEGKPCSDEPCSDPEVFDDFGRTEAGGWGDASSGPTWGIDAVEFSTATVDGTTGLLWAVGGSGHGSSIRAVADTPVTSEQGFDLTGLVQFADTIYGTHITVEAPAGEFSLQVRMGDLTDGNMRLSSQASGPYSFADLPDFGTGTEYRFRLRYTRTMCGIRWWADGDPEPSDWNISQSTVGDEVHAGVHSLAFDVTSGVDASVAMYFEELSFAYCPTVMPTTAITAVLSGHVCEDLTSEDGTEFVTTGRMKPGSEEVWVDGSYQRPGILVDYTASGQIVTFNSPQTGHVRVCYDVDEGSDA